MKTIDLSITPQSPAESFSRIATDLMNHWLLQAGDTLYRITEIEFYLKDEQDHKDGYTHCHPLQKTSHRWYFHGSGIDITFGNENFYGGMLLRALYDFRNDKYHYGPLQILTEIFSRSQNIHDINQTFGLVPSEPDLFEPEEPIAAPRVGLNIKNEPEMYQKLYRFLVMPKKKHAEKTKIEEAMKFQGKYTAEQINKIWG